MVSGLKIKDVSDHSGFSASTLRYYEQIGLLPVSARTPSGYRCYPPDTLERLGFIRSSKQLGCSLNEIAELLVAWDGGKCGPVQDHLRVIVTDKLADARAQIAELVALTVQLEIAGANLERHRPNEIGRAHV